MMNTVNGNGATVTEKLGLDSEVRELKFGSSFNNPSGNKGQQGAFHTIRYDFKPASVDTSKRSSLQVGPNGQVSISMPHYDNSGSTIFKGSTRPHLKECVLIIDRVTGEFVLEKLSQNVSVKKTRKDRAEEVNKTSGPAPATAGPAPTDTRQPSLPVRSERKTPPKDIRKIRENPSNPSSSQRHQHSNSTSSAVVRGRPSSPMTSLPPRHSPKGPSPGHNSPSNNGTGHAFDVLNSKHQQQSFMPSLTSIENLLITQPALPPAPVHAPPAPPPAPIANSSNSGSQNKTPITKSSSTILSDSSSGDDSSSSSSSEDDDDDSSSISDTEFEKVVINEISAPPLPERKTTATLPGSMTMSMPSLSLGGSSSSKTGPTMSMPSHLLSEDLQLSSESGSDSDD